MVKPLILKLLCRLTSADWKLICSRMEVEHARLVRYPEQSPPLVAQRLLISGEDHRHSRHYGFDSIAICRALWRRFAFGSREGASTIEQQIVRTITGRHERTIRRKLREIFLAILIDVSFQKAVLPAVYLSIAYYGWRMNGYRQACRRLGFNSNFLTLDEAAELVARLKYPEARIAPVSRIRQIRRRGKHLRGLYQDHINERTYEHLDDKTIHNRPWAFGATQSVP